MTKGRYFLYVSGVIALPVLTIVLAAVALNSDRNVAIALGGLCLCVVALQIALAVWRYRKKPRKP